MAEKSVILKRYNGSAFDILYPKTTIGQVINLSTQLANMLSSIDEKGNKVNSLYYVVGNTSGTDGYWTGTISEITDLYDGLTIAYKIGVKGASTTYLNINGKGNIKVHRNTGNLTTHLPVNTVVVLTYTTVSGTGRWVWADYDANTNRYLTQVYSNSGTGANGLMYFKVNGITTDISFDGTHTHSQYALGTDVANKIFLKSNTDNRNSNTTPNDYNGKLEIKGLKGNSAIGISGEGTYSALLGLRGWTNSSGGNSHELAFTGNGRIYHRDGATTSWGNWRYLIESDDARLTDARTPLSHTHPMSDITNLIDTLNGKAPSSHNHDNRYYQQVSGKQNVVATSLALGEDAARTIGINSTFKVLRKDSSGEIEEITLTLPNTTNLYEPKFTKNTGFNKNFGTTAGTVAEGNHKHDSLYSPAGHTHDDRYVKTVDQRPVLRRFRSYNQHLTSVSSAIDLSISLSSGMTLMIEVNSHSSYQYTPKIVQITLGDGSYNQLHGKTTFTNYCAGTMEIYSFSVHYYQNQLTFSNIEKLVGTFNSSTKTIEWTTNSSASLYVGRVWTV